MIRCLLPIFPLLALAVGLAACAGPSARGGSSGAVPSASALSFPYLTQEEAEIPGYGEWARRVAPGYVRVTLMAPGGGHDEAGGPIHTGSGMVVDPRGYIVTVAHIARDPGFRARVTTWGGATYEGRILDVVPLEELALIRIQPDAPLEPVTFGDSDALRADDPVVALGSQTSTREFGLASLGWVKLPKYSKPLRYNDWGFDDAVWLSMRVNLGFSGGPVFDREGRVVAMIAGAEQGAPGRAPGTAAPRIAYAVPSNAVARYVQRKLGGQGGG